MPRAYDIVCLSHLRWDFVRQRPQHLMSRFARDRRVLYVEEPEYGAAEPCLDVTPREDGVHVAVPHLPDGCWGSEGHATQRKLIGTAIRELDIGPYVLWYYTPMAVPFGEQLGPVAVVYDCMDELSAFKGAPPPLLERERRLLRRADLVFTGGYSLYEAKRGRHPAVYPFPSSVDAAHFARAREPQPEPADQADIPHPRLGFAGVIDERLDIELVSDVADRRPDWQFVLVGPVVKIDPATLPRRRNVHYLGGKPYAELPAYMAGWDVATLPFARNEATRFISPTKTPEYLAAGLPVVSTSIRDVARPYGDAGLVRIADTPADFVAACEAALADDAGARLARVDALLADQSWDRTWSRMRDLLDTVVAGRQESPTALRARVAGTPLAASAD